MGNNSPYHQSKPNWYQKYPFLIFLTVFIFGILGHKFVLDSVKETNLWIGFILVLIFAILFHLLKSTQNTIAILRIITILAAFFLLGNLADYYNDIRNNQSWYGHYLTQADALKLKCVGLPEEKEKTVLIPVKVEGVYVNGILKPAVGEIKLYLYRTDSSIEIKSGASMIIPNKLIGIKDNGNPFGFKYAEYLKNSNIYHQAFLSPDEIYVSDNYTNSLSKPQLLRRQLLVSIYKNIPDSSTQSLVKATLLNDRSSLDNNLRQAYSTTGIAHIIAISGMHVSILFGVILILLKWIKNKRLEWIKYFIAIPLVWLYIVITNYPPSAVRAAVMFTLLALSIKLNRETEGVNLLIIAAFILLFYNPNWIYDTGVQLSFCAVLSIFTFYHPFKKLWRPKWKITLFFWNIVSVSLAAQVLVFPLVIYYFHQFPIWVLFANIPAAIYSVILMVGALGIFVLDALSIPCIWIGNSLSFLTQYFNKFIYFLSAHTPLNLQQFYLSKLDFWILFLGVVLISSYFLRKRNFLLFSGLGTIILLIFSFILQDMDALKQKKLIVYNVSGNSLITFIEGKQNQTIVEDEEQLDSKNYKFNLFPALLGYRALDTFNKEISKGFWVMNDKRILYLSKNYTQKNEQFFSIDYLILNNFNTFNPDFWYAAFRPKKIILDGSFPRWKAQKWKVALKELGVPVHWVQEDGAWVYRE